jgi:hypothetical protein
LKGEEHKCKQLQKNIIAGYGDVVHSAAMKYLIDKIKRTGYLDKDRDTS